MVSLDANFVNFTIYYLKFSYIYIDFYLFTQKWQRSEKHTFQYCWIWSFNLKWQSWLFSYQQIKIGTIIIIINIMSMHLLEQTHAERESMKENFFLRILFKAYLPS